MTQATGASSAGVDLPEVERQPVPGAFEPEPADAHERVPATGARADWNQLTKPRITLMVVITAYIGYELGVRGMAKAGAVAPAAASHTTTQMLLMLLGTALSCMGAGIFNQVLERDTDALMKRTKHRPLPAGRVPVARAMALGLTLSLLGVALLVMVANPLTAILSAFTILSYALIYTPMKRLSSTCTIVGAVPGAMPPIMGFTAATGTIQPIALVLFAILFIWQLPHFLAIAWLYKDDYARAGLPMLPVIDPDGSATGRQILASCLALLPLGLMPTMLGACGLFYLAGALISGAIFLAYGVALVRGRTRAQARALFFASLIYLPVVYGLMLLDPA